MLKNFGMRFENNRNEIDSVVTSESSELAMEWISFKIKNQQHCITISEQALMLRDPARITLVRAAK